MESTNGIQVEGLVREFKNGPRAVDGIDLEVAARRDLRVPRPQRAGKSTTVHMLTTLLPPTAGTARSPATTSSAGRRGPRRRSASRSRRRRSTCC